MDLEVIDIEPRLDHPNERLIGMAVTDPDQFDWITAAVDPQNPSQVIALYKPANIQVVLRKSFHGGKLEGSDRPANIYQYEAIEVSDDNVHEGILFKRDGSAVRVIRNFDRAKVIDIFFAPPKSETVRKLDLDAIEDSPEHENAPELDQVQSFNTGPKKAATGLALAESE
jgi:hypothetical protein